MRVVALWWLGRIAALTATMMSPVKSADVGLPPPPGFVSFCSRFPDQCDTTDSSNLIALTVTSLQQLRAINHRINEAIWPQDDTHHYGRPEYWTIPQDGYGDCEDYALTKRQMLIRAGLPMRALRLAIVWAGFRHVVLIAATDHGQFALDSLTDTILPRGQTPYVWLEEQDARNPRGWVSSPSASALQLAVK